jgi:hypothetical protein
VLVSGRESVLTKNTMEIFILKFSQEPTIALLETYFKNPLDNSVSRCVRGRTGGAYEGFGSFCWSKGVWALSTLLVRYKRRSLRNEALEHGLLVGYAGSLAATLDWAISKESVWLLDMFGADSGGRPVARRLLLRSNPCLKRPGPVSIGVNSRILPQEQLRIYLNGSPAEDLETLIAIERALLLEEETDRQNFTHPRRALLSGQKDEARAKRIACG